MWLTPAAEHLQVLLERLHEADPGRPLARRDRLLFSSLKTLFWDARGCRLLSDEVAPPRSVILAIAGA